MKYADYKNQAEKFFYFYESKGWMVGKNKMKNWKMAAGNWNKNNSEQNNNSVVDLSDDKIKKERNNFDRQVSSYGQRSASSEEIKDIISAAKKRMVGWRFLLRNSKFKHFIIDFVMFSIRTL